MIPIVADKTGYNDDNHTLDLRGTKYLINALPLRVTEPKK